MKKENRSVEKGKVRFRVVEFELEGTDTSLQESLRSLATALNGGTIAGRTISVPPPKVLTDKNERAGGEVDPSSDAAVAQSDPADDDSVSAPQTESKKSRPPPPKPEFLADLRFDGPPPLDKYLLDHGNPDATAKIYLVIAQWFRDVHKTPEISKDHIYTAYKYLKRSPPDDVAQPLRDGKKNGWFTKGTKSGTFVLHHIGERIISELPK